MTLGRTDPAAAGLGRVVGVVLAVLAQGTGIRVLLATTRTLASIRFLYDMSKVVTIPLFSLHFYLPSLSGASRDLPSQHAFAGAWLCRWSC